MTIDEAFRRMTGRLRWTFPRDLANRGPPDLGEIVRWSLRFGLGLQPIDVREGALDLHTTADVFLQLFVIDTCHFEQRGASVSRSCVQPDRHSDAVVYTIHCDNRQPAVDSCEGAMDRRSGRGGIANRPHLELGQLLLELCKGT